MLVNLAVRISPPQIFNISRHALSWPSAFHPLASGSTALQPSAGAAAREQAQQLTPSPVLRELDGKKLRWSCKKYSDSDE